MECNLACLVEKIRNSICVPPRARANDARGARRSRIGAACVASQKVRDRARENKTHREIEVLWGS